MALEDISMISCLPESVVLYPCDAVSTYKLVKEMIRYNDGISYMRTTRMETPVLYTMQETFDIGKCKVLRQSNNDVVCIIGAGITVHHALKAYDYLRNLENPIMIAVIDCYSIKPLDTQTILEIALQSGRKIITVEDHYIQGGIGQTIMAALVNTSVYIESLAVRQLPRSGTPEELLEWAGIDWQAIVRTVLAMQ